MEREGGKFDFHEHKEYNCSDGAAGSSGESNVGVLRAEDVIFTLASQME